MLVLINDKIGGSKVIGLTVLLTFILLSTANAVEPEGSHQFLCILAELCHLSVRLEMFGYFALLGENSKLGVL